MNINVASFVALCDRKALSNYKTEDIIPNFKFGTSSSLMTDRKPAELTHYY